MGLRGGGGFSPRTFGFFFDFFRNPAVLGLFWNEIFVFGFFGFSAVSRVFLPKPYRNQGYFWNEVIFVFWAFQEVFFFPGLLDFLDFLEFLQIWALLYWNEILVFGFFGFSAVSSVIWSKPYQNQGFFGMRSFLFFGLRGGGGFLPGLLDLLDFLEFLQF